MTDEAKAALRSELSGAVKGAAGAAVHAVATHEKKKLERRARRRRRKVAVRIGADLLLLGGGFMLGVHRKVLLAKARGEALPPAPRWHFWCKKPKENDEYDEENSRG